MKWLTSLPTAGLLVLVLSFVFSVSLGTYYFLQKFLGEHRERAGAAAAAYMTALGSLFAILTGFLINADYSTLHSAQLVVGQEAAASSRLAWSTEGLQSVDTSLVQQRLGKYLADASAFDWHAFANESAQRSPAFNSLQELQATVFSIASRPYIPSSTASAMEASVADLTTARRELISTASGGLPFQLFALSAIAGFALIVNALVVALRSGGKTPIVAVGIIVIVGLDLALILGVADPFRGAFIVDNKPVENIASEVREGLYLPWVGPNSTIATDDAMCRNDPKGCLRISKGESIQLGALLEVGSDGQGPGKDASRGIELAIDYLDAGFDGVPGTLLGHKVEVLLTDDGCSAEGGRAGADRLLRTPRLAATIGTSCSGAALGAAEPIFSKAGIPLLSAENTAPSLTASAKPESSYSRTAPNDLIQGAVDADFVANELGATKVAIVSDGTVYSEQLGNVFSKRFASLGGTALPAAVASESTNWEQFARSLVASGAGAVFMPVNSPVCEDLMSALATLSGTSLPVVTSDACVSTDAATPAGKIQAYGSGPDVTALDRKPFYRTQYQPAYKDIYGQDPLSVWNTSAFDAATMIFDSIQRIAVLHPDGSISLPRSGLLAAIRAIDGYHGVSNNMVCTDTGDCAQSASIAIYRAPAWPVGSAAKDAAPVFSKTETLAAVERRN